ncbi:MAG: hypothetical protein S4CHLAM20_04970 [Chlamydiia bacterium]|nr:hypothetical protein [Chlamydiia bacterium]
MPCIMADENLIRTVDNLPIKTSTQYEERTRTSEKDHDYIQDSEIIEGHVSLDNLNPTLESHTSVLFELNKKADSWGLIEEPPLYQNQKRRLFEHDQAIPALGSDEQIDAVFHRVEGIKERVIRSNPQPPGDTPPQENIDVGNEANKIQSMLKELSFINKAIKDINGARTGIQRG